MMITVHNQCPFCGKGYEIDVPEDGFYDWMDGALVQNAFPEMDATKRECLVSGICAECQDKVFGEDEDPEDDDDYYDDDVDECGFNPYMGCYDYDC